MCESQGRWELRKLSKSGGCGGRWWAGNRFWFPSKVDNLEVPSNRGRDGCGGGWRTDRTPIFHFILWIRGRSNFAFFPRLIFVSDLIFKVIVFLGIQLWEVEQTCKTRKWNQDQTFEPWKRCRGYQSESSRFPREIENNFSSLFFLSGNLK